MGKIQSSFWRRHRVLKWIGIGVLLLIAILAGVAAFLVHRAEPYLRARIVEALKDRFHARVELDSFHMSLVHGVEAQGRGLRIWPPAEVEGVTVAADGGEPLIRLDEFRFHAPLHLEKGKPFHISVVELSGFDIHLPPKSHFHHDTDAPGQAAATQSLITFGVDKIVCDNAHFVLETSKPGKLPLDFAIAHFELTDNGGGSIHNGSVMRFVADLTNPRPVGMVHSTGTIGPWDNADPGEGPIQGDYTFEHADLASFKGIAGILSSAGKYQGTLRDLMVEGDTDTPDFRLTHFGNSMALHTHFHAKVDATNGDTWLDPVDATLGSSHFTATGPIVRVIEPDANGQPMSKGHDIALNLYIDAARIEDFLQLASNKPRPLLRGALRMKAALHIPPGTEPVHQRLTLKGTFTMEQVQFTSDKIQGRITQLSLRGQGRPGEVKSADAGATRSAMQGNFQMANGVITLPALAYTVPGADIQLKGTYGVDGGALDFAGTAKLDATVSEMVGGIAGLLLKPADRFFKKDGAGTEVPIHIGGTRESPEFEVDLEFIRHGAKAEPTPPVENQ